MNLAGSCPTSGLCWITSEARYGRGAGACGAKDGICALAEHPQLYCKLSGLVTEADEQQWQAGDFKLYLDVVFDAFGAYRLMFGSD